MRYTKRAQVRTAAALFIEDRDAAKMAKALGVVERTVYTLIKREDFNAELDALGYTGPRNFRTQPKRKRGRDKKRNRTRLSPDRARAIRLYQSMTDIPEHKRTSGIAEILNLPYSRVRVWIREWRKENDRGAIVRGVASGN